jgi:surface antigen
MGERPNVSVGLAAAIGLAVAGCSSTQVGSTIGGIAGSVAGSQFGSGTGRTLSTLVGGAVGAYFGAEIARALTEDDREAMSMATQDALNADEADASRAWSNPESGNSGAVVAHEPVVQSEGGARCRDFSQSVTLADGTSETATGRACQRADGSWELMA